MPALTRRRYPERQDCWHVYYGDVHVGTIAIRVGIPFGCHPWDWDCGFYPGCSPGEFTNGTAQTFERAGFEAAWLAFLPKRTEADFQAWREAQAFTAWKYQMWETGKQLPTQTSTGRSTCYCGATLTIGDTDEHVFSAHMESA
jgi:hypothetical protein